MLFSLKVCKPKELKFFNLSEERPDHLAVLSRRHLPYEKDRQTGPQLPLLLHNFYQFSSSSTRTTDVGKAHLNIMFKEKKKPNFTLNQYYRRRFSDIFQCLKKSGMVAVNSQSLKKSNAFATLSSSCFLKQYSF